MIRRLLIALMVLSGPVAAQYASKTPTAQVTLPPRTVAEMPATQGMVRTNAQDSRLSGGQTFSIPSWTGAYDPGGSGGGGGTPPPTCNNSSYTIQASVGAGRYVTSGVIGKVGSATATNADVFASTSTTFTKVAGDAYGTNSATITYNGETQTVASASCRTVGSSTCSINRTVTVGGGTFSLSSQHTYTAASGYADAMMDALLVTPAPGCPLP